jgi:hypothetical protein
MGLNERGRGKVPNAALPLSVYQDAARDVREALNSAVEGAGGEGYADARRAYGALKEIERDVGLAVGRSLKNPENKTFWSKLAGVGAVADLLHGNVLQGGGLKLAGDGRGRDNLALHRIDRRNRRADAAEQGDLAGRLMACSPFRGSSVGSDRNARVRAS